MASAIDSKPYHSNSGLVDPYTLAGADETVPQGKPPTGNLNRSPSVGRKTRVPNTRIETEPTGEDTDRIFVQIETMPENEQGPSRHRTRCRCKDANHSPERVVKHDAFITPQPRILTQRATSANRLGQSSQMSKCEAVQIVDLQVSAIGEDAAAAAKERESAEPLVPITRPGSAQPSVRRKKHHVVVISREGREKSSSQRNKPVLASQSLTDLVNRYPDPRRTHRSVSGDRDTRESQNKEEKALSTINSVQGDDDADVQVKAKTPKQVRINSAVQIYDDLDIEENHRNRISHAGGAHLPHADRSRSQVMNITKLRQDYGYKAKTMVADRTRLNIPDNIPQGSVVRIQHTSKGKIKVITGSEGQFTTTILEGNRKPPGGTRPPTRLDLMEDVLVITRKTSTSKDACITSRPSSGNRAIQANMSNQKIGESSVKSREGSPNKKPEKHAYAFRDRVTKTQSTSEAKPKTIELNNPYVQIADGKGEAMQRSETSGNLYYQHSQQSVITARQQQRWKPRESVPEAKPETSDQAPKKVEHKVGKHRQYAQSRYRLQTDNPNSKLNKSVAFQYDSNKPPPVDGTPTVEEDYNSPVRHKWELEYDDYAPPNQEQPQAQEVQSPKEKEQPEPDSDITDAQTLAEKQYYSARHQYVKQWREQHSQPLYPQSQESQTHSKVVDKESTAKTTHTVVMQAKQAPDNPLPPKQQLWSKDSFLQSHSNLKAKPHGSPYALPAPPRSPSRSRSRRRSASRTRRPMTPNTNLVADQLQDDDERAIASRRSRLQATSTELFEDSMYENYAHSKFKSKSRPSSSSRTKPQVVDRETMVKLLHMTMPKKQQEPEQF